MYRYDVVEKYMQVLDAREKNVVVSVFFLFSSTLLF